MYVLDNVQPDGHNCKNKSIYVDTRPRERVRNYFVKLWQVIPSMATYQRNFHIFRFISTHLPWCYDNIKMLNCLVE